jgi:tyrosine decarboxylase/aspartate 1-decarboxylase
MKAPMLEIFSKSDLDALEKALRCLSSGFDLPTFSPAPVAIESVLLEAAQRLQDNFPYFHPLYAGQMLKPPHPAARIAYALALWLNPNNHALDGGRASSAMEKEAVAEIAGMFGWNTHLAHLCSGGTMANLEALWVAGRLAPGKKVVASSQAHYTHQRISNTLGIEFESVLCDSRGRMDIGALAKLLNQGDVGTVVATMGTTAVGSVDPLASLLELKAQHGFRLHTDAAYGGYFGLVNNLSAETQQAFERMSQVDSIVIDPHKHGLQPYGCGCVLFRDPTVGRLYKHDSPYTYFTSGELHLGEISLECSRPGAAAVALWVTQRLLPLIHRGQFAQGLERSRSAAMQFYERLKANPKLVTAFPPELDIVVWCPRARTASEMSNLSRRIFDAAAQQNLHLALAQLPVKFFDAANITADQDTVTCLRSVLMKPEHLDWLDRICEILDRVTNSVIS